MNATHPRAAPDDISEQEVGDRSSELELTEFDRVHWDESRAERDSAGAGGRAVLGTGLSVLAALWLAYTAWAAGRSLSGQPLSSPQIAEWVAVAAGPLALLGLVWLMFGRTRRKEAERFTHSVITMRAEARSLEGLLQVLSQRISDSRSELTMMSQHLMQLGDETTEKLGGITRELDSSSDRLLRHGQALDRAGESARNDMAVVLEDLPRAEQHARAIAEHLRTAGAETASRTAEFERQVEDLTRRTREADEVVAEAAQRLVIHLTHIESAGAAAAERVSGAEASFSGALDSLLERTAATLDEIRSGIDIQSAAVTALVEKASAGVGRAGVEAAEALGSNVNAANTALDELSARVAEQERSSQRMLAEIDRALSELDRRFGMLAQSGDDRAARLVQLLSASRSELEAVAQATGAEDEAVAALAERTEALRGGIERLSASVRAQLGHALDEARGQADHLVESTRSVRPEVEWVRDAAREASERVGATTAAIGDQQQRFADLVTALDEGTAAAEERLGALAQAISSAQGEAERLSAQTGPALVDAMVQVREAATHAAERAREAIASVIPASAEEFSEASRQALERVVRETVEQQLHEVETVASRAVDSARSATDRLTQQMLALGQSATALEQHIERQQAAQRDQDSEAFARRVALLIDSMHSAAIDVGKILSDEVDEKAWESYLKGNRGVFTRRAVRLLGGSESRAIRSHYEGDREFQQSVNRYIHDFEAMLRRVLAERDGGMIAVTLMSSDMGKLYAALAEAIERRR
jgi:ABC-type transporter Mla subunit MlaD